MNRATTLALLAAMIAPLSQADDEDPARFGIAPEATNALGLAILDTIPSNENTLISPYSIQQALVMTYAGAAEGTRSQMAKTLHYGDHDAVTDFAALRPAFLALNSEQEDRQITLSIADRLFGQTGYPFHEEYLALLRDRFAAPLELADFAKSPLSAAKRINSWVATETRDKIRDLVPAPAITEDTRLVLVNAVYFRAPWASPFDEARTAPGRFLAPDSVTLQVPMMRQTSSMRYRRATGYTAVAIPYAGGALQFVIWLPDGEVAEFENSLTPAIFQAAATMPHQEVYLTMPKFKLEPERLALADTLKKLGMPSAFNDPRGSADFSGIAPRKPDDYLYIDQVFHKTFIDVTEAGTEAAAATAVIMMRALAAPTEPVRVTIDRPFLFAIQHVPTATCLFLGRVTKPPTAP